MCGEFGIDYNCDFKQNHDKCKGLDDFSEVNFYSDYIYSRKGISFASPQYMKLNEGTIGSAWTALSNGYTCMLELQDGQTVRETFTILRLVNYIIPSRDTKSIACVYNRMTKHEKAILMAEINIDKD